MYRSGSGGDIEVEAEVRLAGNANLAADEPVDLGVEMDGAGLEGAGGGEPGPGRLPRLRSRSP
ncbi:hypothetical protein RBB78_19690 [Tunturiibacter empetritectus]|uniref:hypothetical protein n=1 Tax=Tunturiibacter empetritectus TaxID=3069691 RepID=UPI003D9BBC72